MSDTPETQEAVERWNQGKINVFDEMARLERERDDYMERCRFALSERDSWRMRAEQKYAMRRELEELLGVDQKDASDEQFQKGLDAIKNIISERDEAIHGSCVNYNFTQDARRERDEAREKAERYRLEANALMMQRDEAREIIRRAKTKFCEEGSDGNIASDMFAILSSGGIAQWLEQSAHNRLVVGSNPSAPTL
jgi:hypothetical protein